MRAGAYTTSTTHMVRTYTHSCFIETAAAAAFTTPVETTLSRGRIIYPFSIVLRGPASTGKGSRKLLTLFRACVYIHTYVPSVVCLRAAKAPGVFDREYTYTYMHKQPTGAAGVRGVARQVDSLVSVTIYNMRVCVCACV